MINPLTGEPLDQKSLRKHFEREITTGVTEAHARLANFIFATMSWTPKMRQVAKVEPCP